MDKVNIMICDDHQIFIDGVSNGLETYEHIEVVATTTRAEELMDTLEHLDVHLVLLDIEMPEINGIQLTYRIAKKFPNIKVIMLSMHDSQSVIGQALKAGAKGYLIKNASIKEIVEAINTIHNGDVYFKGIVLNRIIEFSSDPKSSTDALSLLTERELEILNLVVRGQANQAIADQLFISIHTVHSHRKNILKKLGVKNTAELISFAFKNNLVS